MPWIADGVDHSERNAAELLIECAIRYPDTFRALLEKPWVADGSVTADETVAINGIRRAAKYVPELAEQMLENPWLQDGIAAPESQALKYLYATSRFAPELTEQIQQKPWMRDDITPDEATVVKYLYQIIWYEDEPDQRIVEAAVEIMNMPFLDSVDFADALAVRSLARLKSTGESDFLRVMSHPIISDGIDDEEAKVVVLLGAANKYKPESVPILLDGTSVYKEEHAINLPRSGEALLAIVRLRDHTNSNMDYLEHAVRHHEDFMGEPLPTNYVVWYFDDWTSSGAHYGTHITSHPDRDPAIGEYWRAPRHAAHEAAHYYWHDSRPWITEGGADMLTILSENARVGRPLEPNRDQCTSFNSIHQLELADIEKRSDEWSCNYSLGQRLFLDLYHTLGEDAFQQGFRNLYLKSQRDDPADDCEGTDLGICHLLAAFKADASDEVAAKVDAVVARWYGPLP